MRILVALFVLLILADAAEARCRHRHRRHRGEDGDARATATVGCREEAAGRAGIAPPAPPTAHLTGSAGQPAAVAGSCGTEAGVWEGRRERGRLFHR